VSDVSSAAMRCTSAHSLLTCGYLSRPRVRLYRGSGHSECGGREGSGPRLDLLGLRDFGDFYDSLQFARMPKATGRNSKQNVPTISSNRSITAKRLPGYQWCWCRGFNVGCGHVRSLRTRRHHALKEGRIIEGNYGK